MRPLSSKTGLTRYLLSNRACHYLTPKQTPTHITTSLPANPNILHVLTSRVSCPAWQGWTSPVAGSPEWRTPPPSGRSCSTPDGRQKERKKKKKKKEENVWDTVPFSRIPAIFPRSIQCWTTLRQAFPYDCMGGKVEFGPKNVCFRVPNNFGQDCRSLLIDYRFSFAVFALLLMSLVVFRCVVGIIDSYLVITPLLVVMIFSLETPTVNNSNIIPVRTRVWQ